MPTDRKSVEPVVIPGAPVFTWPVGPLVMLGFGGALFWFVIPTVSCLTIRSSALLASYAEVFQS